MAREHFDVLIVGAGLSGTITPEPFIDFSSGYVLRSVEGFPTQGSRAPWRLHQNYARDVLALRFGAIEDGALVFSSPPGQAGVDDRIAG